MLRRNFFFSHRDLDLALHDAEKGRGFFLYTGRGPSGPMHLGHMVPLLFTKWLQDAFKVNLYIEITDDEKFVVKREMQWLVKYGPKQGLFLGGSSSIAPGVPWDNLKTLVDGFRYYRDHGRD